MLYRKKLAYKFLVMVKKTNIGRIVRKKKTVTKVKFNNSRIKPFCIQ